MSLSYLFVIRPHQFIVELSQLLDWDIFMYWREIYIYVLGFNRDIVATWNVTHGSVGLSPLVRESGPVLSLECPVGPILFRKFLHNTSAKQYQPLLLFWTTLIMWREREREMMWCIGDCQSPINKQFQLRPVPRRKHFGVTYLCSLSKIDTVLSPLTGLKKKKLSRYRSMVSRGWWMP